MYDMFSNDYDRFVNWKNRLDYELPFIISEIQKTRPGNPASIRILDTATGTGMHAIALAQKGYVVTGVDISEGMIEKARRNTSQMEADVKFHVAGFGAIKKSFYPGNDAIPDTEKFDVLLCLGNSLPHVEGIPGLHDALHDFSECLKPGGLLLIQSRNFDSVIKIRERWMEPQSFIDNEGEWIYLRMYDFLPDGKIQFNIVTLNRTHRTGSWNQSIMETRLFPILKMDLIEAVEAAGFETINLFGSLANSPFDENSSGNLVISARKSNAAPV